MVMGRPIKLTDEQRDVTSIRIRRKTLIALKKMGYSGDTPNDIIENLLLEDAI